MTHYGNEPCTVAGCQRVFYDRLQSEGRREHMAQGHVRCNCGWVGTSHRGHVAQRRRRGFPMEKCFSFQVVA